MTLLKKLSPRAVAVAAAAGLALSAFAGLPSAALADAPPVNTSKTTTVTFPATNPSPSYTGIKVNLKTAPANTLWVELLCNGYDPALLGRTTPDSPDVATFATHMSPDIAGHTCTLKGSSPVSSQTVEFSPGTTVTLEDGLPITTVSGVVVIHSRGGGLY